MKLQKQSQKQYEDYLFAQVIELAKKVTKCGNLELRIIENGKESVIFIPKQNERRISQRQKGISS